MSVTDEIKTQLDIVSYIHQFVPLKKAGRNFKACCPFHSEKTPSFVVNPETQTWRCFGSCAEGGDIISFAQKYHGWDFREALEALGQQAGVEVHQQSAEQKQRAEWLDSMRGLMQAAADFYQDALGRNEAVLRYVHETRGFNEETVSVYQIGYAPDGWQTTLDFLIALGYQEDDLVAVGLARRNDRGGAYDYFRNRLMIPIRDERGRVIGFGARALAADDNPKYLNSPQTPLFDKSHVLFGLDRAKRAIRDGETAVIVEGYMDAIQAHQAGYLNVVAQMGTALTEPQLKALTPRYAQRIIMALDSDAAGQNATMRSLEVARQVLTADYAGKLAVDLRILQVPGAKDPDDLLREDPALWPDLVDAAMPVAEYVIETETASLPPQATVQEREAVARRVLPMLLASENDLYKQDNLQKLAMRLHMAERELLVWAAEQQAIERARAPRRTMETSEEPPPRDYDTLAGDMPDEEEAAPSRPRSQGRESLRWELDCLRGLMEQPDLFYQINRKLRELAGSDESLRWGPLEDFGPADFSQGDLRALMEVFIESLAQDDYANLDYIVASVDELLRQILRDEIMVDSTDQLRAQLRHGLSMDLPVVLRHSQVVNPGVQLMKNALRLRRQRIEREREDLYFALMDPEAAQQEELHRRIQWSIKAKAIIDAELERPIKDKV